MSQIMETVQACRTVRIDGMCLSRCVADLSLQCAVRGFRITRTEYVICFFFFQAEDGIRDYKVTGVQTCALPISFVPAFIPRISLQRIDGSEPRRFSRPRRLARSARLSRSALEPRVPGAGIPVIGRPGALLARPAFLQTATAWRCGGLAPG